MKKTTPVKRLRWYVVFFVIALFLIFFVGTKVNPANGDSKPILTLNGIQHLKRGLDLAGGVKLTYKVDLSKYEDTYREDPIQLTEVKKLALNIILKNVDKRISTLGVSDYNAYVQRLSDGEYIVVEIGGVSDIEAAKKLIGKTVELEFKIPNTEKAISETGAAARLELANSIFASAKDNPDTMDEIGTTKGSEDVYYNNFVDVAADELPLVYASHMNELLALSTGEVYGSMLTGVYHVVPVQTLTGYEQSELKGYTVVRYMGRKEATVENVTAEDVKDFAASRSIAVTESLVNEKQENVLTYNDAEKTVYFAGNEILPGVEGYDVAVYQLSSGADQEAIKSALQLSSAKYPQQPNANLVASGWNAQTDITTFVSRFVYNPDESVSTYSELDGTYIVIVYADKKADATLYEQLSMKVSGQESADRIINGLSKKTLYSFQDLFVSDTLSWVAAKDPKSGAILNGAFFKYASVSQSQTGKPVVSIQFDDQGKDIFCNLTESHVGQPMAIFVGGKMMTNPTIREKICGGAAQIDGAFDIAGARVLADDLNSGALPAPLLLSHEETIAPSLGANALNGALLAGLVGLIIIYVVVTMLYGFRKATIAMLGLTTFLVYLLGVMKLFGVVSSLSGIAAVILSVGMAVDANVLIYERMREELDAGKSIRTAIEEGYDRSWSSIRDGNITTGIIGLLLFLVGVGVFKGFGTLMVINTIIILVVMVPLTKQLLHVFYKTDKE